MHKKLLDTIQKFQQSMPYYMAARIQASVETKPYYFPPFVTVKLGNISFNSSEILIIYILMFVFKIYQFL